MHSASDAPPAAPGGTAGPSGDHGEEEDPFVTSTPVQPPNQVSIYFINFILFFLTNLIKGCFHSSPSETFNLQNVSDGSQEGGGDATVAHCHGRIGILIFILSHLKAHDPERILPYVDRGTFVF